MPEMLNMDFSQPVTIDTGNMDWISSPSGGVWRKPLAREAAEHGHATSIVRYEAGAAFRGHDHPRGEEILVLDGTFSDETGDYPAGTYFRNPPGFVHAPFSEEGCLLFVKLCQFQPDDSIHLCVQTLDASWEHDAEGINRLPLHSSGHETVKMLKLAPEATQSFNNDGGLELLIIEGDLRVNGEKHTAGTWVRLPAATPLSLQAVTRSLIWLKSGHLTPDS